MIERQKKKHRIYLGRSISYNCDQRLLHWWILDDDISLRGPTAAKTDFLDPRFTTTFNTRLVLPPRLILDHKIFIFLDHNLSFRFWGIALFPANRKFTRTLWNYIFLVVQNDSFSFLDTTPKFNSIVFAKIQFLKHWKNTLFEIFNTDYSLVYRKG